MNFNRPPCRGRFLRLGVGRFSQDRFDDLVLENRQGGYRLQPGRARLIITRSVLVNEVLATQLLQIVRSMPGLVLLRQAAPGLRCLPLENIRNYADLCNRLFEKKGTPYSRDEPTISLFNTPNNALLYNVQQRVIRKILAPAG